MMRMRWRRGVRVWGERSERRADMLPLGTKPGGEKRVLAKLFARFDKRIEVTMTYLALCRQNSLAIQTHVELRV